MSDPDAKRVWKFSNRIRGGRAGVIVQAMHARVLIPAPCCIPHMLPAEPDDFVDRVEIRKQLARLLGDLKQRRSAAVIVLHGPPGVGKTAMALHCAHAQLADFPGGHFYADMNPLGTRKGRNSGDVLADFLAELGLPTDELPSDPSARASRFRSYTSGAPCLVLLDNVVDEEQVRPFIPSHPASLVLVTSRKSLAGLRAEGPKANYIPLKGLDDEACTELFLLAADEIADLDREVLRRVIPACGGLPGAVRIARACSADSLRGGFRAFVDRLEAADPSVDAFSLSDVSMRRVFDPSYQFLDPVTAKAFRALGAHPTPEFGHELVVALGGGAGAGERALHRLLDAHLLERSTAGRYGMSTMLHGYARTLASRPEHEAEIEEAVRTMTDWYLLRASAVEALLLDRWRCGPLFADPARLAAVFGNSEDAPRAFAGELRSVLAVVATARERNQHAVVCQFAEALHGVFFRGAPYEEWPIMCEWAVEAALGLGDDLLLARMRYEAAFAFLSRSRPGDLDAARTHYKESLRAARTVGHPRTVSSALEGLGQVEARRGRPLVASWYFRQAFEALEGVDHPRGRALLEYHMGRASSAAGKYEDAAHRLLLADSLFRALPVPDRFNAAKSLTRYAEMCLETGRAEEALTSLERAFETLSREHAPKERARVLLVRGDAKAMFGRREAALADWREALDAFIGLGSLEVDEVRRRLSPYASAPSHRSGPKTS
ncbi:tetratricopeptide repeat protein [Streptomyces luteoverticillatus]|uniref:Tetratricopeptide repeat protein n=1 Tax=Streptomyces luteoverticillatus TaxID=66425 RepID=A0A3Q9FZT0_STRLT|nr:NB-ARC domain-containing protein [Streptomyces luteoverticillatus]AZQ74162.1 tetratricopeptide repeat protein [Streptomyces luteoverticillatus]